MRLWPGSCSEDTLMGLGNVRSLLPGAHDADRQTLAFRL